MIYHASREDVFDEFELIGRDVSQRDHHHHHRHTATTTTQMCDLGKWRDNARISRKRRGVLDKNGMIQDTSQTDAVPMAIIVDERNHSHHMLPLHDLQLGWRTQLVHGARMRVKSTFMKV